MNEEVDLWGDKIDPRDLTQKVNCRNKVKKNGYAAPPGTGPNGETCGSCKHRARVQYSKVYQKCLLIQKQWTHGPGTDIKCKSSACAYWEKYE